MSTEKNIRLYIISASLEPIKLVIEGLFSAYWLKSPIRIVQNYTLASSTIQYTCRNRAAFL